MCDNTEYDNMNQGALKCLFYLLGFIYMYIYWRAEMRWNNIYVDKELSSLSYYQT